MNPKDWIDLLQRLFSWFSERRNPVRQQAARVLSTFEAHGVRRGTNRIREAGTWVTVEPKPT